MEKLAEDIEAKPSAAPVNKPVPVKNEEHSAT